MGIPAGVFLKRLWNEINEYYFSEFNVLLGSTYLKLGVTQQQRSILGKIRAYHKWGL
jgi:hypothetical protein